MRLILSVPLLAGILAAASPASEHSIDLAHSHATFSVTHLYVAHVTGSVPLLAGTVSLTNESTIPTSIIATLDPTHIDTHDSERDDSLQGPDWFEVKRFPRWTFTSTSITPGPGKSFITIGTLTIHGVVQPVALKVTTMRGLPNPTYHAVTHIDRHAFGMRMTPLDGTIGNDLEITLDITLR